MTNFFQILESSRNPVPHYYTITGQQTAIGITPPQLLSHLGLEGLGLDFDF